MAVNTHEINLTATEFAQLETNNFLIRTIGEIEVGDYILFKQTDMESNYAMTQVTDIVQNDGLKDGYGLIFYTRF